jgi:hypothetical protein
LTPYRQRDQHLADAVALEVDRDGQPGPSGLDPFVRRGRRFGRDDLNQLLTRISRHDRHAPQPLAA